MSPDFPLPIFLQTSTNHVDEDRAWRWQRKRRKRNWDPKCVVKVLLAQLYLTLCDPMDRSPSGSSVHGFPSKNTGLLCPSPEDLPNPGIKPGSPALHANSLPSDPLKEVLKCVEHTQILKGEIYGFAFSYCSWGSQGKNTEVVCHSLLQWTTFCQNSPP